MPRLPLLLCAYVAALTACGPPPPPADGVTVTTNSNTQTNTDIGEESGDGEPGDGEPGDGDGDEGCFEAPAECLRFVRCVTAIIPEQAENIEEQYGEGGSCWCGTEDEAQDCFVTCIEELDHALESNPTVAECHESHCTLDALDPTQPYGPIDDQGQCPDYADLPAAPTHNPFGIPGSFCAPACPDLASTCPDHPQTSAEGRCYISGPDDTYCVLRCYVDSTLVGGNQCHCGATCRPQGSPDSEGNLRGLCTFD